MSFILPSGQWANINSIVGTTSQSYISFGFNTTSQVAGPAVAVKMFASASPLYVAFGSISQLGQPSSSGMYIKDNLYVDFHPAGIQAQGVTVFAPVSGTKLSIAYFYTVHVDWGRSY